MTKRTPRTYSLEFKQDAVKMCQQPGMTTVEVSRNLCVHVSLLGKWKRKMNDNKQAQAEELTESERLELARLREENKRLRIEREILKKAAAFFTNEKP